MSNGQKAPLDKKTKQPVSVVSRWDFSSAKEECPRSQLFLSYAGSTYLY